MSHGTHAFVPGGRGTGHEDPRVACAMGRARLGHRWTRQGPVHRRVDGAARGGTAQSPGHGDLNDVKCTSCPSPVM